MTALDPIPRPETYITDLWGEEITDEVNRWRNHVLGGTDYAGLSARSAGVAGTETYVNMTSGQVTIPGNARVLIAVRFPYTGTNVGDLFDILVRLDDGGTHLTGSQRGKCMVETRSATRDHLCEFTARYVNSSNTEQTQAFVVTAQRVAGSGTLTVKGGGNGDRGFVEARLLGLNGAVSADTS